MTHIVGSSSGRFKIKEYDAGSNFAKCEAYNDTSADPESIDPKAVNELLNSEIYELKQLWFTYNKKINSLLMILPQEVINRYDMVVKSLQPPVFDTTKYDGDKNIADIFDEVVFKMAQFYFAVFQAVFSKDSEGMRPLIASFLRLQDPLERSRKLIEFFKELHGIIEQKMYYV